MKKFDLSVIIPDIIKIYTRKTGFILFTRTQFSDTRL